MQKIKVGMLILLLAAVLFSECIAQSESNDPLNTADTDPLIDNEQPDEINIESDEGMHTVVSGDNDAQSPYVVWEHKLGDVKPENISQGWTGVKECVKFSPDAKIVAVSLDNGAVRAIDVPSGDMLWEKTISGTAYDLTFSQDGTYLLVGEKSQDGYLYSLAARTGEEVNRYRTANDLNTHETEKYQPAVYRIIATNDFIYAVASRYWKDETYVHASSVYRFKPDGTLVWKFPASGINDRSINWIDSSSDGSNLVFAASDWTNSLGVNAVIHSVDENGKLRWKYEIEPLKPYFTSAAIWHSLAISDDGSLITALTADGRAYLFNDSNIIRTGDYEWQQDISTPQEVGGSAIYAYGDSATIAGDELFYITGPTFPAFYPDDVPMEHPYGNSLMAYDLEGNLSWKYNIEGHSKGISFTQDEQYFTLPVGKNIVTGNTYAHGVYIFECQKTGSAYSKLSWIFNTDGIVAASDISSDGYTAAIEVPVKLAGGDVVGEHRLILLR
ncbi:MAG: PQQ-like beta-propeller repeat protein [Methanosarcinales archaeon]|nr:PQQ-like beta-propeller repeat protein [Methanosarcinales archaeon]